MMRQKDTGDLLDKLTFRTMMILLLIGGMIWLGSMWVEDRFGREGSIAIAVVAIVLITVAGVLMIGLLFAKLYRAGVVDTIKGQQITQEGNTRAVVEVTRAVRGELTHNARTAYVQAKRDYNAEKAQTTALVVAQRSQAQALQLQERQAQEELDAAYWNVPADKVTVQYDQ